MLPAAAAGIPARFGRLERARPRRPGRAPARLTATAPLGRLAPRPRREAVRVIRPEDVVAPARQAHGHDAAAPRPDEVGPPEGRRRRDPARYAVKRRGEVLERLRGPGGDRRRGRGARVRVAGPARRGRRDEAADAAAPGPARPRRGGGGRGRRAAAAGRGHAGDDGAVDEPARPRRPRATVRVDGARPDEVVGHPLTRRQAGAGGGHQGRETPR